MYILVEYNLKLTLTVRYILAVRGCQHLEFPNGTFLLVVKTLKRTHSRHCWTTDLFI